MPPGEYNVRAAGQFMYMQSITIPEGMDHPPHEEFGSSVRAANQRHAMASFFWRERVHSLIPMMLKRRSHEG